MSKLNLYENLIKENLQSRLNFTGTVGSVTLIPYSDLIPPHPPQVLHQVGSRSRSTSKFISFLS